MPWNWTSEKAKNISSYVGTEGFSHGKRLLQPLVQLLHRLLWTILQHLPLLLLVTTLLRTSTNSILTHPSYRQTHLLDNSQPQVLRCMWREQKVCYCKELTDSCSPANFNIKCKNCTIQGNIELVAGSLTMASLNSNSSTIEGTVNVTEGIVDYIEHGYLEFRSNNFMAHVELDSTITASDQLTEFTAPLPSIPITPFQVRIL